MPQENMKDIARFWMAGSSTSFYPPCFALSLLREKEFHLALASKRWSRKSCITLPCGIFFFFNLGLNVEFLTQCKGRIRIYFVTKGMNSLLGHQSLRVHYGHPQEERPVFPSPTVQLSYSDDGQQLPPYLHPSTMN